MEFDRKRGLTAGIAVAAVSMVVTWFSCFREAQPLLVADFPIPGEEIPGQVEVLNATGSEGLARTVTRSLRLAGIDVVAFGNHAAAETTKILVRRGDTTMAAVAAAVRSALGGGLVEIELDSTLLVDVSVVLGADFLTPVDSTPE